MQKILNYSLFFLLIFFFSEVKSQDIKSIDSLKINQVQTLGSHNSYHQRANKFVLNFLKGFNAIAPKEFKPKDLDAYSRY